ncbi:MAG: transcriptional repressor [Actinomycetota bacterium]|nr:transcriptional repressor [Actinomycetota bacterium]
MTVSSLTPPLRFNSPETVLNALRGHGLRVSTARRVVVQALFAAERPMSADEIASGEDGGLPIDLASVYRNLETLEELGVVRHVHAGHSAGRYALTGDGESEYLACERCGALTEVDPGELDEVRVLVRQRFGYEVRFTHFPIVGRCSGCAQGDAPR